MEKLLRRDELGLCRSEQTKRREDEIYTKIFPNKTEFDVQFGMFIPKRFSLCGRYLVSFSIDLLSILVSDVLYKGQTSREFFDDKPVLAIGKNGKKLAKEVCLFTESKAFAIVVSTCPSSKQERKTSSTIAMSELLEDIRFDLISLKKGAVVSSVMFDCDYINLSSSCGIGIAGTLVSILSIKHQRAKIFNVKEGSFSLVSLIGTDLFMQEPVSVAEGIITGFKQRLLAFIYKMLLNMEDKRERIRYFHHQFESFRSLIIWKLQFLDSETVIMQIGNPTTLLGPITEHSRSTIFFVKYKFVETEIVSVSTNSDVEFLEDILGLECTKKASWNRKPRTRLQESRPSAKNCLFERRVMMRRVGILTHHRKEGREMAIRKLALSYPLNEQTEQNSPYLRSSLFQFHDAISTNLKPVLYENKTRFFNQKTKRHLFSLQLVKEDPTEKTNRYASHIFHPKYPLIVTVFYSPSTSFYINVHYRQHDDRQGN